MINESFLSIGTNLGNKVKNIEDVVSFLKIVDINVKKISSIYESEPIGYVHQPYFYNIVMHISTSMNINNLFNALKLIEQKMGRNFTSPKNHPRIIDIDILTFQNIIIHNDKICIPHPELHKRKFVLCPWYEISKQFIVPGYNKDVSTLLNNVKDSSKICKLNI